VWFINQEKGDVYRLVGSTYRDDGVGAVDGFSLVMAMCVYDILKERYIIIIPEFLHAFCNYKTVWNMVLYIDQECEEHVNS